MWWKEQEEKRKISYSEYPYLVYGRVSSEKDEQVSSIENQIDICRHWLEQNNFEWSDDSIVLDEGITGTVLLDREAMQLVLDKAKRRDIKMVIFKSIHRLARDLKDSLEIREVLLAHNVRVVTIEEGYDSLYEGKNDMKFEMFAMFAAQQPKTLSVSISSAMAAKVRRRERVGRVPFGYSIEDKKMIINEKEAPTVRKIFEWYNDDGLGFKNITHKLNEEMLLGNVAAPRNVERWQMTSVQSIIQNPTYAGTFIYNRYTKVKIGGRRKQIQNPREKWVIYENHHPAIIPKDEWEKANNKEVLNKKSKITPWNEFRGLMKCSVCGCNMVIMQSWRKKKDGTKTRWRYVKCSAYRRAGTKHGCVNHTPITYEDLREFVLKRLIDKGNDTSLNFTNKLNDKNETDINEIKKKLSQIENHNKDLIDLYIEDKLISKEEFQQKRDEYQKEITMLKDRLFLLNKKDRTSEEIKNIKFAFQKLENQSEDLFHAFCTLIKSIIIHQDGKIDIEYVFEN